jgi:2OG-Fe(II) oxygenase superfamily
MTTSPNVCTCPTPLQVDLTEAYNARFFSTEVPSVSLSSCQQTLLLNLKQFGWTRVSFRFSDLPFDSPLGGNGNGETKGEKKLFHWENPKESILHLFDDSVSIPNAIYRTAESGSAGESTVEPKKSWESRRCNFYKDSETTRRQSPLDQVTAAMHSIICTVNWMLQLPTNLLVQEEDSETNGCGCRNLDSKCGPCNMDLLRVFHYDKVNESCQEILGSSAHTDWGTFTVVWQDSVGGLQTFCRVCNAWRNVEALEMHPDLLSFVIHVGDTTSLAMAHGQEKCIVGRPFFPSPLHRVLSPTTEPRVSLVYFVYPALGHSLKSLASNLSPWLQSQRREDEGQNGASAEHTYRSVVPYDHFFLLHDQSVVSDNNMIQRSPYEVFADLYNRTMGAVFEEKWQQVQRSPL